MAVRKLPAERPRPKAAAPGVKPDLFLQLYEKMLRAYFVEEQCRLFVRAGKCSFYASARGHEKVQIAVSMLLQPGKDWFFPYYREKALMVGLGMPLDEIFQGMLSREGDINSLGRNMSEHFSSPALRVVSPTACTGTQFLIAVGMAMAVKADKRDEIVYVSGGEGSTSEGEFFEALNKAQHDRLPVLFLIQNNGYAISVPQEQQTHSRLDEVARGFGMRSVRVDGTRFTEMYHTLRPLVEEGEPAHLSDKPITMVEAINHGLSEEMQRNPKIVMWGEDIQDPKGGVFGVTRGLTEKFPGRVENSPLAEATIVGTAQGMAIGGYKPVVEIQFGDYSFPGYMQMRNEIPTLRWRSASAWTCPMVVRVAVGGYIRGGPFHSQTPETLYAHTPGWYLAYPSNAADAKGLIKSACRMDDPILFFEHKGLYRQVYTKTPEPGPDYLIPFGKARTVRRGDDLTVVAWGRTVHMVQQALSQVAAAAGGEPSVEIIDLRTIVPMDIETVLESVARTGRALVAHEAPLFAGMGAEIAARIADRAFEYLDAPVRRIGAQDSFVPFAPNLEAAVLPSVEQIAGAVKDLLEY